MSLTAYNFQFYSYNMATHRCEGNDSGMDVDDIDMSIPPPKPPRAFAVQNSTTSTPQFSWMTSTPKSAVNENQIMATPTAVNYLAVPNETPKSIYPGGLLKGAQQADAKSAELQLRPKLHATQKRWSHELREKALEMSKRSSASSDEENPQTANHLPMDDVDNKKALQLKPQHHAGRKSWSSEIREKALQMSKRNSGSLETSPEPAAAEKAMQYFGFNTPASKVNQQNSFICQTPSNVQMQKPLINAAAYEKINMTASVTSNPANSTFDAYFKNPQEMNTTFDADSMCEQEDPNRSVKDRICFFNKLTSPRSNSFIDLLKNTKPINVATIQHSSSAQNTPLPTPLKPKRWSAQLEMNLQHEDYTPSIQFSQAAPAIIYTTTSSNSSLASSSSSSSSTSSTVQYSSNTTQRKSTLRRRTSVDKTRRPTLRQNSNAGSNGTKPQMHTVMEDLSLVMPVKLRVAEYERRIKMEC
ncbi:protein bottleneck [Lucilia sericata]|uniref:protein bottleneck n=1 Tax=Lucilia sericata TaxID=13632 RepID=UPI0018A85F4F|nr:protein bottleneck [Lucilia sericata]